MTYTVKGFLNGFCSAFMVVFIVQLLGAAELKKRPVGWALGLLFLAGLGTNLLAAFRDRRAERIENAKVLAIVNDALELGRARLPSRQLDS